MIERYADNDEYYTPWSPNASASDRFDAAADDGVNRFDPICEHAKP